MRERTEDLLPVVYSELRFLAAQQLARERPGQTLQPTALVHEAYLRLSKDGQAQWNSRGHFFAAAAEAMRRIMIDQARRKLSSKRGGGNKRLDLDSMHVGSPSASEEVLALDEALSQFAAEEPEAAMVVKLRFFCGCTLEEVAAAMDISLRTANRNWAFAKAWLYDRLRDQPG